MSEIQIMLYILGAFAFGWAWGYWLRDIKKINEGKK